MNILNNNIRQYICPDEYRQLYGAQADQSFIGHSLYQTAVSVIQKRIDRLQSMEDSLGFIYVGEKQWLQAYLDRAKDQNIIRYEYWVREFFSCTLKLNFEYENYDLARPEFPNMVWKTTIETEGLREFENKLLYQEYFFPKKLEIRVFGNEKEISASHLNRVFEFLFDFEYMLSELNSANEKESSLLIDSIEIITQEEPMYWTINVSDCGGEYDQLLLNRKRLKFPC